jgi:hypothetical protein
MRERDYNFPAYESRAEAEAANMLMGALVLLLTLVAGFALGFVAAVWWLA